MEVCLSPHYYLLTMVVWVGWRSVSLLHYYLTMGGLEVCLSPPLLPDYGSMGGLEVCLSHPLLPDYGWVGGLSLEGLQHSVHLLPELVDHPEEQAHQHHPQKKDKYRRKGNSRPCCLGGRIYSIESIPCCAGYCAMCTRTI